VEKMNLKHGELTALTKLSNKGVSCSTGGRAGVEGGGSDEGASDGVGVSRRSCGCVIGVCFSLRFESSEGVATVARADRGL
jgi:hypothetical protein